MAENNRPQLATVACNLVHFLLLLGTCSASMLAVIEIFWFQKQGMCFLYATVIGDSSQINIKPSSPSYCDYCFLVIGISFVFGVVWTWFFAFCGASTKDGILGVARPWRLLPPFATFSFFMFIFMCSVAGMLSDGMNLFCHNRHVSCNVFCNITIAPKDIPPPFIKTDQTFQICSYFYHTFKNAEIGSWCATIGWFLQFCCLFLRCKNGVDFRDDAISDEEKQKLRSAWL